MRTKFAILGTKKQLKRKYECNTCQCEVESTFVFPRVVYRRKDTGEAIELE